MPQKVCEGYIFHVIEFAFFLNWIRIILSLGFFNIRKWIKIRTRFEVGDRQKANFDSKNMFQKEKCERV